MSFFDKLFEDPLKTAAIGTALYFGGPMAMSAMGSGAGAAAAGEAATNASILGGGGEAFGSPLASGMSEQMGDFAVEKGLLSNMPSFKDVAGYAKPVGESMMAANAAKGLLGGEHQQLQTQAPQSNPNASQSLAQLYQPYQMQPRQRVNWG